MWFPVLCIFARLFWGARGTLVKQPKVSYRTNIVTLNILVSYHIEVETKWPPFLKRHFQMHLPEWRCMDFIQNFTETYSSGSNKQYSSIGSDNDLGPTRRQAIIWTNDSLRFRRLYAILSLNELFTTVNSCVKYEYHLLNILGCRAVARTDLKG